MQNHTTRSLLPIAMLGIGGVGMSALAKWYLSEGRSLVGTDRTENERTKELASLGVRNVGEAPLPPCERLVVTAAASMEHPWIRTAKERGIPVVDRAQALSEVISAFPRSIAVAGSHGKTTATAMISRILLAAKEPFTALIGGEDALLGNFYRCGRELVVAEACEYRRNLDKLTPSTAVLLNVDADHMECYRDFDDLKATFYSFAARAKQAVVPVEEGIKGVTFGEREGIVHAERLKGKEEAYSFDVVASPGRTIRFPVRLSLVGRHNVKNALAAAAACLVNGIEPEAIKKGLDSFTSVRGRYEVIGTLSGATLVRDYAHHPREICAVVSCAEQRTKGRLFLVFQPHTYSRTKYLFDDFCAVLSGKRVAILPTYAAREAFDEEGCGARLASRIGAVYAERDDLLFKFLSEAGEGDTVLFLGAGDVSVMAEKIALYNAL